MTKGTPSAGKQQKIRTIKCRRCGRRSYHIRQKACSACGYGNSPRLRHYSWMTKTLTRSMRLR